ncbi:MAG: DUF2235 domain-containing protein [Bacteroidetes bacterium]|nr:DUF2235 domain-containing protein [Bacteroidota bacterium]
MKRIAIFCDGTWNTPDKMENGKSCQTNVVKMANALSNRSADGTVQKLYYDLGIGAEGNLLKKVFDGATGTGISENILQAYLFLMNNYELGDELFLFGFSRGAFTVRSLSGLIRNSGILRVANAGQIGKAYELYRSRHPTYHPKSEEATLFRKTYAVEESTRIKFIGVWDTVGALGNPLLAHDIFNGRNEFHDTELSSKIENAFHALAIDEKRKNFGATLWHQQKDTRGQRLEQVWFAGVHSDVGGGYPETALSDISMQWMLEKAGSCQLSFEPVAMHPDPLGLKHESMKWYYKLGGTLHRPIGLNTAGQGNTNEQVHASALERYEKDPTYRPENLVRFLQQK